MWKILLLTAIFACNAKPRIICKRGCESAYQNDQAKGIVEGTSSLNKKRCYNECGYKKIGHTHGFRSEDKDEVATEQQQRILPDWPKIGDRIGKPGWHSESLIADLFSEKAEEFEGAKSGIRCKRGCESAYRADQRKGTVEGTSYLNKKRCYNECGYDKIGHTHGFGSEDKDEVAESLIADLFSRKELDAEEFEVADSEDKLFEEKLNAFFEGTSQSQIADLFSEEELAEIEDMSEEEIADWFTKIKSGWRKLWGKLKEAWRKIKKRYPKSGRRALREESEDFLKDVLAN